MNDPLVTALVGSEHRTQYLMDSDFHATVEQLGRLLPLWIDALALACAETHRERQKTIEALMHKTHGPLLPPFGPLSPGEEQ